MLALERRWTLSILEAFAPTGGPGLAPIPGEVDYLTTFEAVARASNLRARLGMRAAVWIAALAPIFLSGRLATIGGLGIEARTLLLERMLRSKSFVLRELTFFLKVVASFALLGTPSVRARSGFDRKTPASSALPILTGAQEDR